MPITLELSPDIEKDVREEAMLRNIGVEILASNHFAQSWNKSRRRKHSPLDLLTSEEQQVIADLNAELSQAFWSRYNALQEKINQRTITDEESQELSTLVEQSEDWNIRRIEAISVMAQKRGMRWTDFMQRLQISHHPEANVGRTDV
jgi:hypothetical protein